MAKLVCMFGMSGGNSDQGFKSTNCYWTGYFILVIESSFVSNHRITLGGILNTFTIKLGLLLVFGK